MIDRTKARDCVRQGLDRAVADLNKALRGDDLAKLEPVLTRLGRGGQVPHWFDQLRRKGTLPNLDGKTIGSVLEMLFVAILETSVLAAQGVGKLRVNPASGVDLPDLGLGIKSPAENYCTSEPFFSAYERLLGSGFDVVVLLTDYQTAKRSPPLRLQIIRWKYLYQHEMADRSLCAVARKHREWLLQTSEVHAMKVFKFLAYINQSDWLARQLLHLIDALRSESEGDLLLRAAEDDFAKTNRRRAQQDKPLVPEQQVESLRLIQSISPRWIGVVDAADNWVAEVHKDFARLPNENEWQRLIACPLDGRIGMSFALQWRYNFGSLFGPGDSRVNVD